MLNSVQATGNLLGILIGWLSMTGNANEHEPHPKPPLMNTNFTQNDLDEHETHSKRH